jgi:hypothetical protein
VYGEAAAAEVAPHVMPVPVGGPGR